MKSAANKLRIVVNVVWVVMTVAFGCTLFAWGIVTLVSHV